ncbi:unnamed protein product [Cylindrotheca closterium]|uniref:Isopenicillin N synthase-like Fe(2+) 2OG dioxygenase domain-containing protein n=1 Tax=Cylindrotheca closterium TaxID=2856 RepID=A0AAD2FFS0_9STRA|nr:unnamed protein product [Cylindrotheca closterium]
MQIDLPTVSLKQPVEEIASLIAEKAPAGALWVEDLPLVPFGEMGDMLSQLSGSDELGNRLNQAYTKNMVYKDAYAQGKGGPTVDRKRVLDLSPERLAAIAEADPQVLELAKETTGFAQVLNFWKETTASTNKIQKALASAIGSDDMLDDLAFNYRMVDYYPHNDPKEAPRCGEHRDFGSFTLIHTTEPGLELFSNGQWYQVAPKRGAALMLFGWCTQIRSNGRIPATLHRVVDDRECDANGVVPRRLSAILFCAPKQPETVLEPVVKTGDVRQYIDGIRVGQLRGKMARKWRYREGTEDEMDRIYEEEEIRVTNMKTQDDVVQTFVAV